MYESITGELKEKDPTKAIIEAGGIAYRLHIPLSTYTKLPKLGEKIHLYLSQIIREDAHLLFGFHGKEERDLFETLLTVSGIGPKTAAAIIGHMDMNTFQRAIQISDITLLSKLPGIGKKTAERLVLDMRDKFKIAAKKENSPTFTLTDESHSMQTDAIYALINLGYSALEAQKAVAAAQKDLPEKTELGGLISLALQKI